MRRSGARLGTWIVVAAIGALAAAAALDALHGGGTRAAADEGSKTPTSRPNPVARELAAAGVEGALSYVDGDCRAHTLRLPAADPVAVPTTVPCRIAPPLRPPPSFLASSDATLTAIRRESAVLVGARSPREVFVRKLAWLDDARVAAIVASRSARPDRRAAIAVFERGRLVGTAPWLPTRTARFFVSPRGSFFAVAATGPSRFFLLDRDAREGVLPDVARDWFGRTSVLGARAIAWSPDERWTALAKDDSVYVFTTDEREPKLVRLPIAARDLAWD